MFGMGTGVSLVLWAPILVVVPTNPKIQFGIALNDFFRCPFFWCLSCKYNDFSGIYCLNKHQQLVNTPSFAKRDVAGYSTRSKSRIAKEMYLNTSTATRRFSDKVLCQKQFSGHLARLDGRQKLRHVSLGRKKSMGLLVHLG